MQVAEEGVAERGRGVEVAFCGGEEVGVRRPGEEEVGEAGKAEDVGVVVCEGQVDRGGRGVGEEEGEEGEGWEGGAGAELEGKGQVGGICMQGLAGESAAAARTGASGCGTAYLDHVHSVLARGRRVRVLAEEMPREVERAFPGLEAAFVDEGVDVVGCEAGG